MTPIELDSSPSRYHSYSIYRVDEAIRGGHSSVLKGMSVLDVMKALMGFEVQIWEEYVTQAHARIGLVDEINPVAKRLLEEIAADEEDARRGSQASGSD